MVACSKSPTSTTTTYIPSCARIDQPKLGRNDEDQAEHTIGRKLHCPVDDGDNGVANPFDHVDDGLRPLARNNGQGGAEYQREENQCQHVHVGSRRDRVSRDDIHKGVDAEIRRAGGQHPLRAAGEFRHQFITCLLGQPASGFDRVDQRQADGGGDQRGQGKVAKGPATQASQGFHVADTGDTKRNRGENDRHHGHEQHTQENLANREHDIVRYKYQPGLTGGQNVA